MKANEPQYIPTVTDELAAAVALLMGALDESHELHGMIDEHTAKEVAKVALQHYQAQQDKGGKT